MVKTESSVRGGTHGQGISALMKRRVRLEFERHPETLKVRGATPATTY